MKKKIFGSLIVIAIVAVVAFNMNLNLAQESNMSPLALANVEALANNESGGSSEECDAGGPGANSCTITKPTIGGTGGASKSVTCNSGYYACCKLSAWGALTANCIKE
jgi:hypothetical protein